MSRRLDGRLALVTGGGTGIGSATAELLAEAGAEVVVCGRREDPLMEVVKRITEAGGLARYVCADITTDDGIATIVQEASGARQQIDVLIHNAGLSSERRSARWIEREDWENVLAVNLLAPALLTRAILPGMVSAGEGDIVLVGSVAGIDTSLLSGAAYSAAKAGALAYMKTLASEVQPLGIRCMSVSPGEVDTPILERRAIPPGDDERSTMIHASDVAEAIVHAVTTPRSARLSDVVIRPMVQRNLKRDIEAGLAKGNPQEDA